MAAGDMSALLWKSGQILGQWYWHAMSLCKALSVFQGSAECSWTAKGEIPAIYASHQVSICERQITLWKMRNCDHLWEVRRVWTISKVTFSWKSVVNNALSITNFVVVQTWIYCSLPSWRSWQSLLRYEGWKKREKFRWRFYSVQIVAKIQFCWFQTQIIFPLWLFSHFSKLHIFSEKNSEEPNNIFTVLVS